MVKHSLVAYDGSPESRRAFAFAVDLARCSGSRVRVISVLQVTEGSGDSVALLMTDSGAQRTQTLLDELVSLAPDARDVIDVDLIHGSPGDVLIREVAKHQIDHIVIGHTGRGALARFLLGSVTHDVLAHAQVPVTIVR